MKFLSPLTLLLRRRRFSRLHVGRHAGADISYFLAISGMRGAPVALAREDSSNGELAAKTHDGRYRADFRLARGDGGGGGRVELAILWLHVINFISAAMRPTAFTRRGAGGDGQLFRAMTAADQIGEALFNIRARAQERCGSISRLYDSAPPAMPTAVVARGVEK